MPVPSDFVFQPPKTWLVFNIVPWAAAVHAWPYVHSTLVGFAVPLAPFALNVTVNLFADHVPVIVAVPLYTPRFSLLHVTDVFALNVLPLTVQPPNVYPSAVMASGVVNVPPYVQLAGVVGAVPRPPFAHFNVIVFAVHAVPASLAVHPSLHFHFAYSDLLPVEPLAIWVILFVNDDSVYQPKNVLFARVGVPSVIVAVVTLYDVGAPV